MNLYEMLEQHEGYRQYPYSCPAGKLTIGIGRNIEDRGITLDEAHYLLRNDVLIAEKELTKEFAWYFQLTRPRQNAMIDLFINMGMPTLKLFRKFLAYMRMGDYDEAADELLLGSGPDGKSKYYHQVGSRAETIAIIIRTGRMP